MTSVLPKIAEEKEFGPSLPRPLRVTSKSLHKERQLAASVLSSVRVVYIEGQRLYFRALDIQDEPLLRKWVNDPVVRRHLQHRGPLNSFREREFIESQGKSPQDYVFGMVAKQSDRMLGVIGLHNINPVNRSAVLGISIGDVASQGRGYGREAIQMLLKYGFEELNLNRISLSVFADNWRAIRAYQKAGFKQEGCSRQAQYREGRYQDEYHFAMLRSEWEALSDSDPLS